MSSERLLKIGLISLLLFLSNPSVWAGSTRTLLNELRPLCEPSILDNEACLRYAQYLAWNGWPIRAYDIGSKLELALGGGAAGLHPELAPLLANVLTWQGNYKEALARFDDILTHNPSIEATASYINTLLRAGYNKEATLLYDALPRQWEKAEYQQIQERVTDNWKEYASPALSLNKKHYSDAYDITYRLDRYKIRWPANNHRWLLNYSDGESTSGLRRQTFSEWSVGIEFPFLSTADDRKKIATTVTQYIGSAEHRDGEAKKRALLLSKLQIESSIGRTKLALLSEKKLFLESPLAYDNSIYLHELSAKVNHQLSDQHTLYGRLERLWYSDDNISYEWLNGFNFRVINRPALRVDIGPKLEYLTFEHPSNHYFSPDKSTTLKGQAKFSSYRQRFSYLFELFVGRQKIDTFRAGSGTINSIAGSYGEIVYRVDPNLKIDIVFENGHFALNNPYAYRYTLIEAGIELYF